MSEQSEPAHYPAPPVSTRAVSMPASPIRRSFMAARALEAQGTDVIRLDIGDPDFDLPQHYSDAVIAALHAKHTHYSPVNGLPEVRAAVSAHMQQRFGLDYPADQIVINQGATQGLNAAQLFCCSAGDTLLLPEVYWANYIQQVALAGLRPAFYKLNERFEPVLTDLACIAAEARTAGSRIAAVLVNTPSNPTGALFSASSVDALYAFAVEHNSWVISDEAYCDYVFRGQLVSPLQLDAAAHPASRRVLGVFSGSKSYASTGLRMGWTVAPSPEASSRLGLLNEPLTGSLTTPLQYGLAAAVAVEDAALRREQLRERWEMTGRVLHAAGLKFDPPEGGLFYFIDVSSTGMDAERFAERLLREQHVAVVPGGGFGLRPAAAPKGGFESTPLAQRHVRLCFAVPSPRLRLGIERLASFIRNNQQA